MPSRTDEPFLLTALQRKDDGAIFVSLDSAVEWFFRAGGSTAAARRLVSNFELEVRRAVDTKPIERTVA